MYFPKKHFARDNDAPYITKVSRITIICMPQLESKCRKTETKLEYTLFEK